jgi:nitroimidazol reductase NimA-like FMN-containing flavoprotein (pyridoxamine 5'-phosphate oxidase superfamily)
MGSHTTWSGMEILDPEECWAFLSQEPVGRLAVSITDHPDIFPINHIVDRQRLLFRSAEGTKLAAAVLGRAVAYEVDGYDAERRVAWSVVVKGRAEEIELLDDLLHAMDLPLFPWHEGPKHRWVRITPDELTGRRFKMAEGAHVPS